MRWSAIKFFSAGEPTGELADDIIGLRDRIAAGEPLPLAGVPSNT